MNKICVYAICKNEYQFVDKWLASMSEADYIVVLDTGSTDGTYEFLQNDIRVHKVEQKIINPWRFDVARNESMKLIPEDANILVCTDLDEIFETGWAQALRSKWIKEIHKQAIYKYTWSHADDGMPLRTFQYDKIHNRDWHWEFPVHETLRYNKGSLKEDWSEHLWLFDDIYLHHYADNTKSRSSYLPLLELRKQENPNDHYGRIYLAHEYFYRDMYKKSIEELTDILDNYSEHYSKLEQASCFLFMGDSYAALENYSAAVASYQTAIFIDRTYREPYINLAQLFNQLELYHQAIGTIQECLKNTYRHYTWLEREGSWLHDPYDTLCIAYYWIGEYKLALENAEKALYYNPKDERLMENLRLSLSRTLDPATASSSS